MNEIFCSEGVTLWSRIFALDKHYLGSGEKRSGANKTKKKSISIRAWARELCDEEWVGHVGGGVLQNVLTDSCSIIEILWLSIISAERWQRWSCCKQDVRKFLSICSYLCRQSKTWEIFALMFDSISLYHTNGCIKSLQCLKMFSSLYLFGGEWSSFVLSLDLNIEKIDGWNNFENPTCNYIMPQ